MWNEFLQSYKDYFTKDYLMGPNSVRLVEELLVKNPDAITGGTVLDLGCGKALTSVYLANETNAKTVYATDLWVSATENWETIQRWKLEDAVDTFQSVAWWKKHIQQGCEDLIEVTVYE